MVLLNIFQQFIYLYFSQNKRVSIKSSFAMGIALGYWSAHSLFRLKLSVGLEVSFKVIINDIRNKIQKGNAGRR